jgi:hypothetical protein
VQLAVESVFALNGWVRYGRDLHTCLMLSRTPGRFRDPRSTKYDFLGDVLVCCPKCSGAARVFPAPGPQESGRPEFTQPRRLVCLGCGLAKESDRKWVAFARGTVRQATDPYFDLPLWLQVQTRHGWLWAYNVDHLMLIRGYVEAPLRERAAWYDTRQKMTMVARLPLWIKKAKNREDVLRAVDHLRKSLPVG